MTRGDLIEAGAVAVATDEGRNHPTCMVCRNVAGLVVDAVEPLIRADERERHTVNNPLLLADLRARMLDLPPAHDDACVWLRDVIGLIDGDGDD